MTNGEYSVKEKEFTVNLIDLYQKNKLFNMNIYIYPSSYYEAKLEISVYGYDSNSYTGLFVDFEGDGIYNSTYKTLESNSMLFPEENGNYKPCILFEHKESEIRKKICVNEGIVISDQSTQEAKGDKTKPRIVLNGDYRISLNVGDTYIDAGATAYDNIDGTVQVSKKGNVDTDKEGVYILTYVAQDKAGNKATQQRIVKVIAPDIVTPTEIKTVSYPVEGSYADDCSGYNSTGCEKIILRGSSFEKSWQFKNSGNVVLNGVSVVPIESSTDTALSVSLKTQMSNSLSVGSSGSYVLNISVPSDARPGIHQALFKLTSNGKDLQYENGNTAYFWYKFKIKEDVPTITLNSVPSALVGSIFTFVATLNNPLGDDYTVKISLGDNSGGWLSPQDMVLAKQDRTEFALAQKITKAGDRKYRVAIFRDGIQVSSWKEGSYKVIDTSKIPQDLKAIQQSNGVLLTWNPVVGAQEYMPYYSLDGIDYQAMNGAHQHDYSKTNYFFGYTNTDAYFKVQADDGELSEAIHFVWKDGSSSDIGVYIQNGIYITITRARANMNQSNPPLFQFNLKHEIDDDRDMVQFTTKYESKEAFDNAFGGSNSMTLSLVNRKLTDLGMEIAGLGWIGHDSVSDNFSITVRKNSDGTYDLASTGSFVSDGRTISSVEANYIAFKDEEAIDLNALVGKTVYQYCTDNSELFQMTFQDDGQLKMQGNVETEYVPYRIDGNTVYTTEDGTEKGHTILEWTDKYIKFTSKEEYDDGTFYFSEADARVNPESDCGEGSTKISDLVSGHFDFVNENNSIIANIPSNLWVRITPEDNQIEGHWNGVNCKIDSNGNFGGECYIHNSEEDMRNKFSSSYDKSYQIVIYQETTGDTHYNKEESQYGYIKKEGDVYELNYGAWQSAIVVVNNHISLSVDNSLSVNISMSGNTMTAVFNKDMMGIGYSTTGNYNPQKSYWTNKRTFKIDFNSYQSGGVITLRADGFISAENKILSNDVSFTFP